MILIIFRALFVFIVTLFLIGSPAAASLENFLGEYPVSFHFQPEEIGEETLISLQELATYLPMEFLELQERILCLAEGGFFLFRPGTDKVWVHPDEQQTVYPNPLIINGHYVMPLGFVENFFQEQLQPEAMEPLELHLLVEEKSATLLECILILRNNTPQGISFSFHTGQKYDVVVEDMTGRIVTSWSRDKSFTQAMETMYLEGGESKAWVAQVALPRIRPGRYLIQGMITGRTPLYRNITSEKVEVMIQVQ